MPFTGIGKLLKDFVVSTLATKDKTIPGAINELNSALIKKQDSLAGGSITGSVDDAKTPGLYWCDFKSVTGTPYTSGFGWCKVLKSSNYAYVQIIYRFNSGVTQIAIRGYTNSQWYPWRVINTTAIS